jgi:hypothetical protein
VFPPVTKMTTLTHRANSATIKNTLEHVHDGNFGIFSIFIKVPIKLYKCLQKYKCITDNDLFNVK